MSASPTLTWWGASAVAIEEGARTLAIDPYLNPGAAQYVCVTREDWDHCHEPTLRAIVAGPDFERLLAPPSCRVMSRLDAPVGDDPEDLAFVPQERLAIVEPRLARKTRREQPTYTLGPFEVDVVASSEREQPILLDSFLMHRWRRDDGAPWPEQSGRFVGGGLHAPVGYLVRLVDLDLTIYHPSDLQEAFDFHRELRGQVDVMLFPSVMLEGVELTVLDNIRPRFIVPIHHRTDDPGFPIPLDVDRAADAAVDLVRGLPRGGTAPEDYAAARRRLHAGHWYASADPSLRRLRSLAPALADIGCELVVARAGEPLALAALGAPAADSG